MKSILIQLFELFINPNDNIWFYDTLWLDNPDFGAPLLTLGLVLIPAIVLFIYYKIYDPVLPMMLHWAGALIISFILVFIFSAIVFYMYFENMGAIVSPESVGLNYDDFPMKYVYMPALILSFCSLIIDLLATFFYRFISLNNKHNPF